MKLSLTTPPVKVPLDWGTETKIHLRLDSDEEKAIIEGIRVPAARDWVESLTNRQLITATWTVYRDSFPADGCPIILPKPPLQDVTSVKYYDQDGVLQTWADTNYNLFKPSGPKAGAGGIIPKYGVSYPTPRDIPNAVEIEIVCGYGVNPAHVPGGLRAAMLLLVGELHERREEAVTGTIISKVQLSAQALALPYLVEV